MHLRRISPTAFALLAVLISATIPTFAQAPMQPPPPPGQWQGQGQGHRQGGPLMKLGLSELQWQQVRQIRERYRGVTDPALKREERFEVLSVLTVQQREQLFAMERKPMR